MPVELWVMTVRLLAPCDLYHFALTGTEAYVCCDLSLGFLWKLMSFTQSIASDFLWRTVALYTIQAADTFTIAAQRNSQLLHRIKALQSLVPRSGRMRYFDLTTMERMHGLEIWSCTIPLPCIHPTTGQLVAPLLRTPCLSTVRVTLGPNTLLNIHNIIQNFAELPVLRMLWLHLEELRWRGMIPFDDSEVHATLPQLREFRAIGPTSLIHIASRFICPRLQSVHLSTTDEPGILDDDVLEVIGRTLSTAQDRLAIVDLQGDLLEDVACFIFVPVDCLHVSGIDPAFQLLYKVDDTSHISTVVIDYPMHGFCYEEWTVLDQAINQLGVTFTLLKHPRHISYLDCSAIELPNLLWTRNRMEEHIENKILLKVTEVLVENQAHCMDSKEHWMY
jgi:hypothetical protein